MDDSGTSGSDLDHHAEDARLEGELRRHYPRASFPAAAIEATIRETLAADPPMRSRAGGPRRRWWEHEAVRTALAVAASLVLFIGGAEYGRRTAVPAGTGLSSTGGASPTTAGASLDTDPLSIPLSIQASGTRYVASLARFAGETERLTPEERRVAREVAVTALSGALLELLAEWEDEASLRAAVELLVTTKAELGQGGAGAQF